MSLSADSELQLDFSECPQDSKQFAYHSFGSTSIKVIDSELEYCVIEYYNEIEGGYSINVCRVPKTLGKFIGFDQIKGFCSIKKSGSIFNDLKSPTIINLPFGINFISP